MQLRGAFLALCSGILLGLSPAPSEPGPDVAPWLRSPTGWEAHLAPPEEPGGRFVMEGRVLGPGDLLPLAGITLYAYHADGKGLYALKGDAPYPRLAGVLRTDARGRYRLRSTMPGQYAGAPHVHFEVWGSDWPASSWAVNLYMGREEKDDPAWGHMASVRNIGIHLETSAFVTRDARGLFHARYDLHWDRAYRLPAHVDSLRRGLLER